MAKQSQISKFDVFLRLHPKRSVQLHHNSRVDQFAKPNHLANSSSVRDADIGTSGDFVLSAKGPPGPG